MATLSAPAAEAARLAEASTRGLLGWTPRTVVLWTIVIGLVLHLLLSGAMGYGNGESYYIATARFLELSYFDQPPLFLWLTHFMLDGGGMGHVWLRLPYVLMFAGSTWLMYRLGALLYGEAAGMWAAILLNLSPLFFVSIGMWIQPDGPLFLLLLAAGIWTAKAVLPDPATLTPAQAWGRWLMAGLFFGLALLSKYHAALTMLGVLLFLLARADRRGWLARPQPWVAALLALAIFLPAIIWNAENGWVSFAFQGGRSESFGLHPLWLGRNIAGQATYVAPWLWIPLLWVLVAKLRRWNRDITGQFLALLAVIPIVLFTVMSLWANFLYHFHWQAPGYLFLFPVLGAAVARRLKEGDRATWWWLAIPTPITALVLLALGTQAATGWMAVIPGFTPKADPTIESVDWLDLRTEGEARGWFDHPGLFMVGYKWFQAGKIDVPVGDRVPVLCLCDDPRNMAFRYDHADFAGHDAIIVLDDDDSPARLVRRWGRWFDSVTVEPPVVIHRAGLPEITLQVLSAKGYRANYPMPLPPAPEAGD